MQIKRWSRNQGYQAAVEDFTAGNYKSARNRLIKLIKKNEEVEVASTLLSYIEYNEGKFEKAEERINSVLTTQDFDRRFNATLIAAMIDNKLYGKRAAKVRLLLYEAEKLTLDSEKDFELRCELSKYLSWKEAEEQIVRLKEVYSKFGEEQKRYLRNPMSDAFRRLGRIYEIQGQDEEALENYKEMLEIFPKQNNNSALYRMASICGRLGRREEALEYLERIDFDTIKYPHFKNSVVRLKEVLEGKVTTMDALSRMYFEECTGEEIDAYILPKLKRARQRVIDTDTGTGLDDTPPDTLPTPPTPPPEGRMYPEELSGVNRLAKLKGYSNDLKSLIICRGIEEFEGYLMFKYSDAGMIILEKFLEPDETESYGNATYILPMDIEIDYVSLTKRELKAKSREEDFKIATLNHNSTYYERLDSIVEDTKKMGFEEAMKAYDERRKKHTKDRKIKDDKADSDSSSKDIEDDSTPIISDDVSIVGPTDTESSDSAKKKLDADKKQLEEERSALEEQKKVLEEERRTLEEQKKALEEEKRAFEEQKKALEEEREKIAKSKNEMQRTNDEIVTNILAMMGRMSEMDAFSSELAQKLGEVTQNPDVADSE